MKKLVIVLFLGILITGSVFAQWGNGYNRTAQTLQTITGTLQIINGILAIVNASNQVYYVPNLQPYYGAYGLLDNTTITLYGNIGNNNYFNPYSFMVSGTWYNFPVYNYYAPYAPPPVFIPMYVPMYTPCYPGYFR